MHQALLLHATNVTSCKNNWHNKYQTVNRENENENECAFVVVAVVVVVSLLSRAYLQSQPPHSNLKQ